MIQCNSYLLLVTFIFFVTYVLGEDLLSYNNIQLSSSEPNGDNLAGNLNFESTLVIQKIITNSSNNYKVNKTANEFENIYSKRVAECHHSNNKVMVSFLIKSFDQKNIRNNWNNNGTQKTKLINCLSTFFGISEHSLAIKSLTKSDINKMIKGVIKTGPNNCKTDHEFGVIEFTIGCGKSWQFFDYIKNKIAQYNKDSLLDFIDSNFCWWLIWEKDKRFKRETEGSGEEEYGEYDYGEEDDEEKLTTATPTTFVHAHRHHHGAIKADENNEETTASYAPESNISTPDNLTVQEFLLTTLPTTYSNTITETSNIILIHSSEKSNIAPIIKNRLPKLAVTAGKVFAFKVPEDTFLDSEDIYNLKLNLADVHGRELKSNSWIQYNITNREIYGMPLEDHVSHWKYKLIAIDSRNESISETVDIAVQQYKGFRSVNHEIVIVINFNQKFLKSVDWQIQLMKGISETLNVGSSSSQIIVREIRQNQDPLFATFTYYNETLPKDVCPTKYQLNSIIEKLHKSLNDTLYPYLSIKSVNYSLIGNCEKSVYDVTPSPFLIPHFTKNYSPVPRNQVDRVNATVGFLLVFRVPPDTFYDPEDTTDLKLSLLTMERTELNSRHWLQFDSKNQEFYGIPKVADYGSEEYLLVAEDREGLTATDALVVVVNHAPKREFSVYFKVKLGINYDQFNSQMQRKFVEGVAKLFNDPTPQYIQVRSITQNHDSDETIINFYNTTLHRQHNRCPEEEIEMVRNLWFSNGAILRDRSKKIIGNEFNLSSIQIIAMPIGSCHSSEFGGVHRDIAIKAEEANTASTFKDDYVLTFVLPAVIILLMVLLASLIACILHKRRLTGKMDLGDEEERKSFRSKGIPVIFQDELDEKPEIGNKSPIILKDEKPPLLPPSYNSTNIDGDNDCDEYVPPPAVIIGNREIRGKSPVTPSYRKPPPYVSP